MECPKLGRLVRSSSVTKTGNTSECEYQNALDYARGRGIEVEYSSNIGAIVEMEIRRRRWLLNAGSPDFRITWPNMFVRDAMFG